MENFSILFILVTLLKIMCENVYIFKFTVTQNICMKFSNYKIEFKKHSDFCGIEVNSFPNPQNKNIPLIWLIVAGLVIGFVNGFWGGGGGMICVPVLTSVLKLPEKVGHATTLLIMLPLSIASFIVYLIGGSINWFMALEVGGGFVLGGALGALLLKNMSNIVLKILFAIIIIAGGIKLIL